MCWVAVFPAFLAIIEPPKNLLSVFESFRINFDTRHIYVPLTNQSARNEIFKLYVVSTVLMTGKASL